MELVTAGRCAVVDYGLGRRAEREGWKSLVRDAGGVVRLLYFPVPREELLRRLDERNRRDDANALTVTGSALDDFFARFDVPRDEDEEIIVHSPPLSDPADLAQLRYFGEGEVAVVVPRDTLIGLGPRVTKSPIPTRSSPWSRTVRAKTDDGAYVGRVRVVDAEPTSDQLYLLAHAEPPLAPVWIADDHVSYPGEL